MRAKALEPDYIALGPIYPTLLKKMPWAPQGLTRITGVETTDRRLRRSSLSAGSQSERLPPVFGAGADIAAVVTDIVRNADPGARTREDGWRLPERCTDVAASFGALCATDCGSRDRRRRPAADRRGVGARRGRGWAGMCGAALSRAPLAWGV